MHAFESVHAHTHIYQKRNTQMCASNYPKYNNTTATLLDFTWHMSIIEVTFI